MAGFHNAVAKFPRSEGTATQLMFDDAKMCIYAFGSAVPSDATAGYATGCLFIHTDGGDNSSLYCNEGTSSSCDFNAVTVQTAASAPTAALTTLTTADSNGGDYALSALTTATPYGLATQNEATALIHVIINTQARCNQAIAALQAAGLMA